MSKEIKNYITYFFKSNKRLLFLECLVLFVFMPFVLFNYLNIVEVRHYSFLLSMGILPALLSTFALGFLLPLFVWNYLYKRTSCDLYYSLPISKTKMYWLQYSLGVLFGLIPLVINGIIDLLLIAFMSKLPLFPMIKCLLFLIVIFLITYSIFTFVCMKCNNLLDAIVVSGAYVVVPAIVILIIINYVANNSGQYLIAHSSTIVNELINTNLVASLLSFPIGLSIIAGEQITSLHWLDDSMLRLIAVLWIGIGIIAMLYSRHCYVMRNEEDAQQRTRSWMTFPLVINSIIISLFLVLFSLGEINTTTILMFFIVFIIYAIMRLFANRSLQFKMKDFVYFIVLCLIASSFTFVFHQSKGFGKIHEIPNPDKVIQIDIHVYGSADFHAYRVETQQVDNTIALVKEKVINKCKKNNYQQFTIVVQYYYGENDVRERCYSINSKDCHKFEKAIDSLGERL